MNTDVHPEVPLSVQIALTVYDSVNDKYVYMFNISIYRVYIWEDDYKTMQQLQ